MNNRNIKLGVLALFLLAIIVGAYVYLKGGSAQLPIAEVTGTKPQLIEPHERFVPVMNVPKAEGWPAGDKPVAAQGLVVKAFAESLDHPRWMLVLPNGDVLVAETNGPPQKEAKPSVKGFFQKLLMGRIGAQVPSPNRITLLRDSNGDGVADQRSVLLKGLNSPFGMALVGDSLYVGDTDALLRFPFKVGDTTITAKGEKIASYPGGGHWTRNVVANADGSKIYVAVGSASNIGEGGMDIEKNRAAILEVDAKTHDMRIFAGGIRNPVGMAWEPTTNALWAVANERDMIGSDLVPDYLTMVQFGGFYGWPRFYWGGYIDKRVPEPADDMQSYVIRPDYALGPHVAALGLTFAKEAKLGSRFTEGAFVGLHGSWNRRPLSGYKVVFVPFAKGRPTGAKPIDILTGFLGEQEEIAKGRPVGVVIDKAGALLVADDVGNKIWRITPQ